MSICSWSSSCILIVSLGVWLSLLLPCFFHEFLHYFSFRILFFACVLSGLWEGCLLALVATSVDNAVRHSMAKGHSSLHFYHIFPATNCHGICLYQFAIQQYGIGHTSKLSPFYRPGDVRVGQNSYQIIQYFLRLFAIFFACIMYIDLDSRYRPWYLTHFPAIIFLPLTLSCIWLWVMFFC